MNINKMLLAISMMASYAVAEMKTKSTVPSIQKIESTVSAIDTYCAKKCTKISNLFCDCTRRCEQENQKRLLDYMKRKFINQCAKNPDEGNFFVDPDEQYKKSELKKTRWLLNECHKDPKLNSCFEDKSHEFDLNVSSFLKERYEKELKQLRNLVVVKD